MIYEPAELVKNNFTFYLCISVLVLSVNITVLSGNKPDENNVIKHLY